MKKLYALGLLFLTCCVAGPQVPPPASPTSSLTRYLSATVVLWDPLTAHTYCSGVIIAGRIFTAEHCVEREGKYLTQIWLKYWDGQFDTATLLRVDPEQDWAILKPGRDAVGVRRAVRAPRIAERVLMLGHPQGNEWTLLQAHVAGSGVRRGGPAGDDMRWWQMDKGVAPGMSGGPCINSDGDVFGLVSFIYTKGWSFTACADITSI